MGDTLDRKNPGAIDAGVIDAGGGGTGVVNPGNGTGQKSVGEFYTLSYSEGVAGWVSFYSYNPFHKCKDDSFQLILVVMMHVKQMNDQTLFHNVMRDSYD